MSTSARRQRYEKLRTLAEHPRTPEHEAAAASHRAADILDADPSVADCHICGATAEFTCVTCERPTCHECDWADYECAPCTLVFYRTPEGEAEAERIARSLEKLHDRETADRWRKSHAEAIA